jgi:hypothetical protein
MDTQPFAIAAHSEKERINMERTRFRRALIAIDGFAGVSALLGMAILLLDWPIQFPAGWLQRTPFKDYTVPALILGLVVGGSWIVGEIVLLDRSMPATSYWAQAEYLLVGMAMVTLALRPERRSAREQKKVRRSA